MKSYISPKTEVRTSNIQGKGLFAIKPIKKGEIIAIKGGHIFDERTLDKIEKDIEESYIQIEDNFYIGAMQESEIDSNKLFLNHSCEPNVGIRGQITFVAMRDIKPGEELTYDWAMENAEEKYSWKMKCNCRATRCRRMITGIDWKHPDLQRKYKGFFSSYIQNKIDTCG